jgi:hypothetical protein
MAKADKTGQVELTVEQQNAIDLLIVGKTDLAVAEAVGKSRQTVCGWRLYHPTFQAALNARRQEVWAAAADRLRNLVPRAVDVLERELAGGDHSLKVALAILKLANLPLHSIGAQDPEQIVAEVAESQSDNVFAHLRLDIDATREKLLAKAAVHDGDS